jgi:hypothetical protein
LGVEGRPEGAAEDGDGMPDVEPVDEDERVKVFYITLLILVTTSNRETLHHLSLVHSMFLSQSGDRGGGDRSVDRRSAEDANRNRAPRGSAGSLGGGSGPRQETGRSRANPSGSGSGRRRDDEDDRSGRRDSAPVNNSARGL